MTREKLERLIKTANDKIHTFKSLRSGEINKSLYDEIKFYQYCLDNDDFEYPDPISIPPTGGRVLWRYKGEEFYIPESETLFSMALKIIKNETY